MTQSPIEFELTMVRSKNGPLSEESKGLLRMLASNPTLYLWRLCYNMVIASPSDDKPITVWRAVKAVDNAFQSTAGPRNAAGLTTWDRIPDAATILNAFRWATH